MVKLNAKFKLKDLDKRKVKKEIKKEAKKIYKSNTASYHYNGNERSLKEIVNTIKPSKICEEYLIQKHDFTYNPDKWHDVISPNGDKVEVKVIRNDITDYHRYINGIYNKIKSYNKCDYIYAFKEIEHNKFKLVYIFDVLESERN